jgi:hypothetical protein
MKRMNLALLPGALLVAAVVGCSSRGGTSEPVGTTSAALSSPITFYTQASQATFNSGSYNLHLQNTVRFNPIQPGSDPVHGRELFGLAADLQTEDATFALFQGPSQAYGGTVVSNGRTCFTCHRGVQGTNLGLPPPPLSASIPSTDALFTGEQADMQGDPDGPYNLDQLALIKYRPSRFNLTRSESDPIRQVFGWRKSMRLVNVAFAAGFLNDGRGRVMFEVDRGAVFSHTQSSDNRFDDLFSVPNGNDLEAFQFSVLSDPRLAALRDPTDPNYPVLVNNPFYTVNVTTASQLRGEQVFVQNCMSCHSTPNVFNNLSNVEPLGNGTRPPNFPSFGPAVGRLFNIGVAERNKNHLRFSSFDPTTGQFSPILFPLANEDGSTTVLNVTYDIGLAAVTDKTDDVGRFKVPQLRDVRDNAPYFHDNSAASLAEVVDYFNSDFYNQSKDGRLYPIHLCAQEKQDLLAFLQIL